MDIKTAVIYRLNDLIKQKDITVNEAAVRSGVPPSTLKNILYGQSRNAGVVTTLKPHFLRNRSIPRVCRIS